MVSAEFSDAAHQAWMSEAIRLAWKGKHATSPNPMVGALVLKNRGVAGRGYHRKFGGPHAEIFALRQAGKKSRGATLVVTLEPCASWGKTPPCVSAILESGIRKVVVGALDPNPANHGKGIAALRKAGLEVVCGVLAEEVKKQNEGFFKWAVGRLPFVTLKMAQSLDGKIATREGASRWISSPASRKLVRRLRAGHDAVLVGKNTFLQDDPSLSAAAGKISRAKPWRVVLDPDLKGRPSAKVFGGAQMTFRVVSEKKISRLTKCPGVLLPVPEKNGRLDLRALLSRLASFGVTKLLVEGGGETAWSFIAEGLVDYFYWIVAPKIIGGRAAKTSVEGEGVRLPSEAVGCRIMACRKAGEDWIFEGTFR